METEPPNPYDAPKTEAYFPESEIVQEDRQIIPPLTRLRLVIAIALVTGTLIAIWAVVNHQQFYCLIVASMCFHEIPTVLDPRGLRRGFKWIHSLLLSIAGFGVYMALLWERELPVVTAVLRHPASYSAAWLIGCSLLLMDWWKRRNNPPYQPDPHARRSVFSSLWRVIARIGNRR